MKSLRNKQSWNCIRQKKTANANAENSHEAIRFILWLFKESKETTSFVFSIRWC